LSGSPDADRRKSGWNDKYWHDRYIGALPKSARILDLGCGGAIPIGFKRKIDVNVDSLDVFAPI
jgi:hypothetical protein